MLTVNIQKKMDEIPKIVFNNKVPMWQAYLIQNTLSCHT